MIYVLNHDFCKNFNVFFKINGLWVYMCTNLRLKKTKQGHFAPIFLCVLVFYVFSGRFLPLKSMAYNAIRQQIYG